MLWKTGAAVVTGIQSDMDGLFGLAGSASTFVHVTRPGFIDVVLSMVIIEVGGGGVDVVVVGARVGI